MTSDPAAHFTRPSGHPVSRRNVLKLIGAMGLTGSAALEYIARADVAWATSYEYIYPTAARTIYPPPPDDTGGSFQNHVAHRSCAPGVDYSGNGTTYGSAVVAVKAGTIVFVKSDTSGTYGRQVHIDHGDGSLTKYMHLNATSVTLNAQVNQGNLIGQMGGSASGVERKYAAHIHICLQISGAYVDFDMYVQQSIQITEEQLLATDVFYWVGSGSPVTTQGTKSPVTTVTQDSLWYQECIGAPLFKVSNTVLNSPNSATNLPLEYQAFQGARNNNANATRTVATTAQLAALIDLRGEATAPIAGMAPLRT
jgi:hypothetical protein